VPKDEPAAEVLTIAKKSLKPPEHLDNFGGCTFHGVIEEAKTDKGLNALPVGLAPEAEIVKAVAAGQVITWDDVKLNEHRTVVKLRRQQDAL